VAGEEVEQLKLQVGEREVAAAQPCAPSGEIDIDVSDSPWFARRALSQRIAPGLFPQPPQQRSYASDHLAHAERRDQKRVDAVLQEIDGRGFPIRRNHQQDEHVAPDIRYMVVNVYKAGQNDFAGHVADR